MTLVEIRQTTDGYDIADIINWSYDEAPINSDDPPRFKFTIPNISGIEAYRLYPGKAISIKRNGESVFVGSAEKVTPEKGNGLTKIVVEGIHTGYHYLRRNVCSSYDFEEGGGPVKVRGGVTVNPWSPFIFRQDASDFDAYGNLNPLDGVKFSDYAKSIIGTKFIHQHDYRDDSFLLPSTVHIAAATASVYIDSQGGFTREALALKRIGTTYTQTGSVESIELHNGDSNIRAMGIIASVDILIIGQTSAATAAAGGLAVSVCRNAGESSRTYHAVTLTLNTNYLSSGRQAWTGSYTFADSPTEKNNLGYKIEFTSPSADYDFGTLLFGRSDEIVRGVNAEGSLASWGDPFTISSDTSNGELGGSGAMHIINKDLRIAMANGSGANVAYFYKSTNGGRTWSRTAVYTGGATQHIGMDYVDASTYVAAMSESDGDIHVYKTTNGGQTWAEVSGSPLLLPGAVILGLTLDVYDANNWSIGHTSDVGDWSVFGTTDAGSTWAINVAIEGSQLTTMGVGQRSYTIASSTVHHSAAIASTGGNFIARYYRSGNAGSTWTPTDIFSISNAADNLRHARVAISPTSTSNLYFCYVQGGTTGPNGLKFTRATDGGSPGNWSTPVVVDSGAVPALEIKDQLDMVALTTDIVLIFYRVTSGGNTIWRVAKSTNASNATSTWTTTDIYTVSGTSTTGGNALIAAARINAEIIDHLHYMRIDAVTATDTNLTNGTIDTYDNPALDGLRNGEEDWIEKNFLGMTRAEALEALRTSTESSTASSDSPHWDAWITSALALNFQQRRGTDLTKSYSFEDANVLSIKREFFGNEVAYQTIAYGAGSDIAQTSIVSKQAFTSGGLYDADRDPTTGAATDVLAGIAQVRKFIDSNEKNPVALLRKSRAYHKMHRNPMEHVEVEFLSEFIRYFNTGDTIPITESSTRLSAGSPLRAMKITRSGDGKSREKLAVDLGDSPLTLLSRLRGERMGKDALTIRGPLSGMVAASGSTEIKFDSSSFGLYKFTAPPNRLIRRFILRITTIPYQSNSTTAVTIFKGNTAGTNPVFCEGIQFGVDLPRDSNDNPTSFTTDKNPDSFGDATSSITNLFDVTNFMDTDASGALVPGEHVFHFKSAASTNNSAGLAALSITPFVLYVGGN